MIFLKHGKQKNLHEKSVSENEIPIENYLVIEFESEWSQSQLGETFGKLDLVSLQFNGGTYIVSFKESVTVYDLMNLLVSEKIPVQYFRNISNSTRRFFVS